MVSQVTRETIAGFKNPGGQYGDFWRGYTGDVSGFTSLEQAEKAAKAMELLGDDWMVMNDYRNANPQTRGLYDEFRTKYYQQQAVAKQRKAEQEAAQQAVAKQRKAEQEAAQPTAFGQGAKTAPEEGDVPVYDAQGRIVTYTQPGNQLAANLSYQKPILFAGTGAGATGGTTGTGTTAAGAGGTAGGGLGSWWEGGGVQWPSRGLATAASGRVPGQANLLPSLGAPGFLSPQSMSRLTPSELDIYGSEVERRGFPMQDWQAQLKNQWGGFASPGQFGGGGAFAAPGRIR